MQGKMKLKGTHATAKTHFSQHAKLHLLLHQRDQTSLV